MSLGALMSAADSQRPDFTPMPADSRTFLSTRGLIALLLPLLLGGAIACACLLASGVSLGLFFGPLLLATFAVPALALAEPSSPGRLFIPLSLSLGVWLPWVATAALSPRQSVDMLAILVAYCLCLGGVAALLQGLRLDAPFASALATLLGFAWLTWPVWLCPWLSGPHVESLVNALALAHPLLALNGLLLDRFGAWDRYPLAYQQLTTLNQDILYSIPRTIWPTVVLHGALGGFPSVLRFATLPRRPAAPGAKS